MRTLICLFTLISFHSHATYFAKRTGDFINRSTIPNSQLKLKYDGSASYYDILRQHWAVNDSKEVDVKWKSQDKFEMPAFSVDSGPIYLKRSSSLVPYVDIPSKSSEFNGSIFSHEDLSKDDRKDSLTFYEIKPIKLRVVSASGRSLEDYLAKNNTDLYMEIWIKDTANGETIKFYNQRTNEKGEAGIFRDDGDEQFLLFNKIYRNAPQVKVDLKIVQQQGGENGDLVVFTKSYTKTFGLNVLEDISGDLRSTLP